MFEIELDPAAHLEEAILRVYSGSLNLEARSISFHWDVCNTVGRVIRYGDVTLPNGILNKWMRVAADKQKSELIKLMALELGVTPKEG